MTKSLWRVKDIRGNFWHIVVPEDVDVLGPETIKTLSETVPAFAWGENVQLVSAEYLGVCYIPEESKI